MGGNVRRRTKKKDTPAEEGKSTRKGKRNKEDRRTGRGQFDEKEAER